MKTGDIVTFKEIRESDLGGHGGRIPAFKVLAVMGKHENGKEDTRPTRVLVQYIPEYEGQWTIIPTNTYLESDLELMWSESTSKNKKEFRVVKIDKAGKEEQIHMESNAGDRVRFYAGEQAWTVKCFITGKVSKKQLEKITDVWYMLEKQCKVKIGDKVTA